MNYWGIQVQDDPVMLLSYFPVLYLILFYWNSILGHRQFRSIPSVSKIKLIVTRRMNFRRIISWSHDIESVCNSKFKSPTMITSSFNSFYHSYILDDDCIVSECYHKSPMQACLNIKLQGKQTTVYHATYKSTKMTRECVLGCVLSWCIFFCTSRLPCMCDKCTVMIWVAPIMILHINAHCAIMGYPAITCDLRHTFLV